MGVRVGGDVVELGRRGYFSARLRIGRHKAELRLAATEGDMTFCDRI